MSMVINNNMMAVNAARSLSSTYSDLNTSVQRMSSGLRINSSADDAAGLAIREMMKADIAVSRQGIRNAADAISMLQTADGSLGIIDEKLIRMKELAEQAASGTYTTVQRDIINSEYQAMAKEIDRIANATNFNGIKLLDGSVSNQHGGQGIKIHFGISNNEDEDYYFINMGDSRATSSTGLRVGGDAKNDIWGQGAAASGSLAGAGCCTAGFPSLHGDAGFADGQSFSFGYNWDWKQEEDAELLSGKYLAGRYTVEDGESLQDLVEKVNYGTQSRVGIKMDSAALEDAIQDGGTVGICVGDDAYIFGSAKVAAEGGVLGYKATASVIVNGAFGLDKNDVDTFTAAGIATKNFTTVTGSETHIDPANIEDGLTIAQRALKDLDAEVKALGVTSAFTFAPHEFIGNPITAAKDNLPNNDSMTLDFWTDNKGNFTTDEKVAGLLGFQQVTIKGEGAGELYTATLKNGDPLKGFTLRAPLAGALEEDATSGMINTALEQAIKDSSNGRATGQVSKDTKPFRPDVYVPSAPGVPDENIVPIAKTEPQKTGTLLHDIKKVIPVADRFTNLDAATGGDPGAFTAENLARAINDNTTSKFWAMVPNILGVPQDMVYVFAKEGGDNNDAVACEMGGYDDNSKNARDAINFENVGAGGPLHEEASNFSLGGEKWATVTPVQSVAEKGHEVWNLTLEGRDVGKERDIWIANEDDLRIPGIGSRDGIDDIITGLNRESFVETQNADDAPWAGAEIRTQSSAQEALDALTAAIIEKDQIRADIGAMQNRLENTMTNLEIQTENLMASESRISDVDVATEMTEFTKKNVLVQAATSMLAQANGMSQMALSLLG